MLLLSINHKFVPVFNEFFRKNKAKHINEVSLVVSGVTSCIEIHVGIQWGLPSAVYFALIFYQS
ncbi:MAG: hypothetical protein ABI741_10650, partial [Ferruginibacter sp.]